MKHVLGQARVLVVLRLVLGATFLYAALTKLADIDGFAESVANYRLLPAALVPVLAAALLGIEIVAGLALMAGRASRGAALLLAVLIIGFVIALTQALIRDIDMRCGCFGGTEPATWWTVARDLLLLALALPILAWGPGQLRLAQGEPPKQPQGR